MKRFVLLPLISLAACAPTTPAALSEAPVSVSITSAKSPHDFAACVSSVLPDVGQMMNDGAHYWIIRQYGGASFERWDFIPTPNGSVANRHTGRLASYGTDRVRRCA